MPNKDKNVTPSVTNRLQELGYNVADWDDSLTSSKLTKEIINVFSKSSKKQNGNQGYPDRVYCNKKEKLLILVEEKSDIKLHKLENIEKGSIAGIKWYLKQFANKDFENWKILGIAVSGNLSKEYEHFFDCFYINKDFDIKNISNVTNFLKEKEFLALFNNLDEEKAVDLVSSASKEINQLLRSVDSQQRPIILSSLLISLYNSKEVKTSFKDTYKNMSGEEILNNLYPTIEKVLTMEGIPIEKVYVLKGKLEAIKVDVSLKDNDILKNILKILEKKVLPLFEGDFSTKSNFDIIGHFYEEFLKYAGVSDVKKGIVLTPKHITTLFTKLVPIKSDDIILDLCCGTGAFLIAGMNKIIDQLNDSDRSDKKEAIENVKEKQLLGFEINPTMYICAISNMLFRGDGKSSIYNYDSINDERVDKILKDKKPTIGFINPPYSGKESATDPTPKEITFLTKLLDSCSRYGIIIAPLSTFFKDKDVRNNILKKHTLKYSIIMPKDLFGKNASVHTNIAVFETNRPHNYKDDEVIFYDLRDDGLVKAKNKGRIDLYNKWESIEKDLLEALKPNAEPDDIILVKTTITKDDEWLLYDHSKTDYTKLNETDFMKTVSEYLIFSAKKDLNLLEVEKSEFEILDILSSYYREE